MNDDDMVSDFLQLEADRRKAFHINSAGRRPLSDGYELVGLAGEVEFATTFDQPLNLIRRHGGDGGIDFVIPLAFTVDVKCLRDASNLLVEEGTAAADIYVLAEYSDATRRRDPHRLGVWVDRGQGPGQGLPPRDCQSRRPPRSFARHKRHRPSPHEARAQVSTMTDEHPTIAEQIEAVEWAELYAPRSRRTGPGAATTA